MGLNHSQLYTALANCPDGLTDEIEREKRELSITPNDRRQAYLDLKILRRDIMLLALGIEGVQEDGDVVTAAVQLAHRAASVAQLACSALKALEKRVEALENEKA